MPAFVVSPEVVVDAGPVMELAKALPPSDVLLSLVYTDSAAPYVGVVERDSTYPDAADTLRAAVHRAAHPRAAPEPWAVRLRVVTGLAPGLALERAEHCPPLSIERGSRTVEASDRRVSRGEVREFAMSGGRPIRIVLRIDARGRVQTVVLAQSSGSPLADELALEGLRERRFHPALLDGVPVPGTHEVRVSYQIRGNPD